MSLGGYAIGYGAAIGYGYGPWAMAHGYDMLICYGSSYRL